MPALATDLSPSWEEKKNPDEEEKVAAVENETAQISIDKSVSQDQTTQDEDDNVFTKEATIGDQDDIPEDISQGAIHANLSGENTSGDAHKRSPFIAPLQHSTRRARFKAFWRSLLVVDHTQLAFVPGMRTALIIMLDWSIKGIGNPTTTAFQLGCLYVGFTDPNGNLSRRLRSMGLTLACVVIMGALLPGLVWRHPWAHFWVAFAVAFATGLSPLLGSPPLFLAMKLGTALFAINGAVNRNTNGYGGIQVSIGWTFLGGFSSLLAALLPEIIGNRDAVRTDLFKVFHGFGKILQKWGATWGTTNHIRSNPVPFTTVIIGKTHDLIFHDNNEDPKAREWLLGIVGKADDIRAASLCLSNGYKTMKPHFKNSNTVDKHKEMDDLYRALGCACQWIGRRLQFPWTMHSPCLNNRLQQSVRDVEIAVAALKTKMTDSDYIRNHEFMLESLPGLADYLQAVVKDAADQVLDVEQWPSFSSFTSLPRRVAAAFPSKLRPLDIDASWAIRGYAFRFAIAFSLASIPELLLPRTVSAHWFPMTVALIMGPTYAATFEKIVHRTVGTLLGIALGSALIPLFDYPAVLIILLGLNTYAVCVFFQASYVVFTFFITAWVFCTNVGVGGIAGKTTFYRCAWTLAAAILVSIISYVYPPKTEYQVSVKLATMAKAIKPYAEAVLAEHQLRFSNVEDESDGQKLEEVHLKVKQTREDVIKARVAMLTCIHEAVLTPNEPSLIDPHVLAPMLASDLIDAVVVPQAVSLLGDQCGEYLLKGMDERSFVEIDRLVARLELHASLPFEKRVFSSHSAENVGQATSMDTTCRNQVGPFFSAISSCMRRLDEAGVPSK